jgi:beta-lactamase regulating signal transducer with metallopeptidase domain
VTFSFMADDIPVSFDCRHPAPVVGGLLYPRILLPAGIDRLLNRQELNAALLHEVAHARRRDNLILLLYEVALCACGSIPSSGSLECGWHSLYRELSCDESVIQRAHGQALVRALAKLAIPEEAGFLQATGSSHLSHRLARLVAPLEPTPRSEPSTDVAIHRCHRGRRVCRRCTYRLLLRIKTLTFASSSLTYGNLQRLFAI